jgi:hypothetical protein
MTILVIEHSFQQLMQLLEVILLESDQMQSHVGDAVKVKPVRERYGW